MRAAQRIVGNTTVILIGKALGLGVSVATVFLLTANLSKADFGSYNFVYVYIGIFSVVTEMGMSPILVREMARNRAAAGEILGTAVIIKTGFALLSLLCALAALAVVKPEQGLYRMVFILGLQLFAYPLLTCTNIFKLELKMIYPTLIDLVRNVVYLGGLWYILRSPSLGLSHIFALAVITSFIIAGLLYWLSRKYVRIRFVYRPDLARALIRSSIPLGLSQLAIICYYRVDTLMLYRMKGEVAVGYYSLAVKIAEVFNYFPSALMVSVYPFFSSFWHENRQKFLDAVEFSLRALLAVGLPIAIMGSLFSRQIISLVPGGYEQSAGSLAYLIWAEVFIFLNMVFYNALNAMNLERWNLWSTLFMLGTNVVLNLVLIPQYSHQGASLATMTTEAIGFILLGTVVLLIVRFQLNLVRVVRILAAGLLVGGLTWVTFGAGDSSLLGAIGGMLVGSLFYIAVLIYLKVLDFQEIRGLLRPQG